MCILNSRRTQLLKRLNNTAEEWREDYPDLTFSPPMTSYKSSLGEEAEWCCPQGVASAWAQGGQIIVENEWGEVINRKEPPHSWVARRGPPMSSPWCLRNAFGDLDAWHGPPHEESMGSRFSMYIHAGLWAEPSWSFRSIEKWRGIKITVESPCFFVAVSNYDTRGR